VVGHGHGPSTTFFREHAKSWREKFGLDCFTCGGSPQDPEGLGIQTDHAAMNETSLVMALRPDLVRMDRLPSAPGQWPVAVWGRDPRTDASPEVGHRAIALQTERMAGILRETLARVK